MRGRIKETLINPTWEQIVEHDPLINQHQTSPQGSSLWNLIG